MGSAASEVIPSGQTGNVVDGSDTDTDEIRADIETTRAELTDTVNAIQEKLSPANVTETTEQITTQVKDTAQEITEQAVEKFKSAALEVTEQATAKVKDTVTEIREQIKSDIHDATIGRVEKMANNLREGSRGASTSLVGMIKENPIPAALVGFGLAWLFFGKLSSDSNSSGGWREDQSYSDDRDQRYGYGYDYDQGRYGNRYAGRYEGRYQDRYEDRYQEDMGVRDRVSNAASGVASGVSDAASNVASGVSEAADNVKYKAGEFVDQAQERVGMVGQQLKGSTRKVANKSQTMMQENPLMAGAVALALGAAVGLMLPVTERENELMGQARDQFVDQAGGVVHETMDKAQRMVSQATEAAKESVKREMQNESSSDDQ
jgi:ElaB/YqjD/DUF883 family membrane-anchored ribosome-binding protein